MALVESVLRELLQEVEDRVGLLRWNLIHPGATLDEDLALLGHFLRILLSHGATKEVGLSQRVACQGAGCLLHLFLVDDDAVGLGADLLQQGVGILDFLAALFALDVVVDELHRTGAVQRDKRDDVGEVLDLESLGRRGHAAGLELEDADRFAPVEQVESRLVIHRDLRDVEVRCVAPDELHGIIDDGQGLQAQEVHLEEPQIGEGGHGVLADDVAVVGTGQRDVLGEVAVGNDDSRRVDAAVARKSLKEGGVAPELRGRWFLVDGLL